MHRSLDHLRGLREVMDVIPNRCQVEAADPRALNIAPYDVIPEGQRVVFVQLIVDARTDARSALYRPEILQPT